MEMARPKERSSESREEVLWEAMFPSPPARGLASAVSTPVWYLGQSPGSLPI